MHSIAVELLLVRVYAVASDTAEGKPLHDAIVAAARAAGLSGATVIAAKMGLSRTGRITSDLLSDIESDRQPFIVELVDQPDRVAAFLPTLHALVRGRRLITLERAEVMH